MPKEGTNKDAAGHDAPRPTPYHKLTPEQRNAAWAAVRDAQRGQAKKRGRLPLVLVLSAIALIWIGVWIGRTGHANIGIWFMLGAILAIGFAVISFAKSLVHGMPWDDHEVPPPPGM